MTLELHARYSKETAIADFDGEPQFRCDDEFAVLFDAVLGFFTVGDDTTRSQVPSASTVTWRPQRFDYAPSDEYPWLPVDVREVFCRTGSKIVRLRRHHIFLRAHVGQDYLFAGEAHLGSYGCLTTEFTLSSRLPRDFWLECGGYAGWQVDLNHTDHQLEAGNLQQLSALLDRLADQEYSHFSMTRYEEDSLAIHTNAQRAWVMYLRDPADCGLYLDDPTQGDSEEHFKCTCGISLDVPASQTTSHEQAAEIAKHFFLT